jgi:NADH-ubiquinone oxidoreductase chain 4L
VLVLSRSILLRGLLLFSIWRRHLLVRLLSLEYIVLGVFVLFSYSALGFRLIMVIGYLTITACEGALGLSILVSIMRTHGGDYFRSFRLI